MGAGGDLGIPTGPNFPTRGCSAGCPQPLSVLQGQAAAPGAPGARLGGHLETEPKAACPREASGQEAPPEAPGGLCGLSLCSDMARRRCHRNVTK